LAVAVALHPRLRDWVIVDERSAGFFALGMARQLGEVVAVVCTSGTAAANLLPAVAEASLSEVPLLVLTADRPPELRDCAAAQTIDQVRLFGSHARWAMDLPVPTGDVDLAAFYRRVTCRATARALTAPRGPVHVNLPLREPLLPAGAVPALAWAAAGAPPAVTVPPTRVHVDADVVAAVAAVTGGEERGVIVCGPRGGLAGCEAQVAVLADRLGWPVLADPLSGVRFGGLDPALQVDTYDLLLRDQDFRRAHVPRVVLRFGAPPVSKALAQHLAARRPAHQIVVATPGTWPDPEHVATTLVHADAGAFLDALAARLAGQAAPVGDRAWSRRWRAAARLARAVVDEQLAAETTLFEGKVAAEVIARLPAGAVLHVGNSMPVRDLDTFGAAGAARVDVAGNRGANGIDGVLSTALGAAAVGRRPVVLVVGDLSFLHDLGGLQIAARHRLSALVVVIDNDGGGVFSFLPQAGYGDVFERHFGTPHGLDLAPLAAAAGARVRRVRDWDAFHDAAARACAQPGLDVVVVPSDRALNATLHDEYVAAALARLRGAEVAA
jgi:2-succinyl-5-enolpyruvyl-6-hydroxy-3-cyclohexene-1-carboxylate synthase